MNHTYLQNLETNIHDLHTQGLLNSHANRWTTTNVGHMHGGFNSEINLGELHMMPSKFMMVEHTAHKLATSTAAQDVATIAHANAAQKARVAAFVKQVISGAEAEGHNLNTAA